MNLNAFHQGTNGNDGEARVVRRLLAVMALTLVNACGNENPAVDAGTDSCPNLGTSSWEGTESVAINSGSCSQFTNLSVTFGIVQGAATCSFTLTNSRASGILFTGTISGDHVSWTTAPYPYLGGTLTLNSVAGTLSSDRRNLSGQFTWTLAGATTQCTGTTSFNVNKQ